ncbi:hypothetical protein DIPPA_05077 [Diplonema papillatum]|nr:hypothetical protein DIPPA_05077 [Diplonema papillatum]
MATPMHIQAGGRLGRRRNGGNSNNKGRRGKQAATTGGATPTLPEIGLGRQTAHAGGGGAGDDGAPGTPVHPSAGRPGTSTY